MHRAFSMFQRLLPVAIMALIPGVVHAQDAAAVLQRVSDAMGAGELKSIRYTDEGTGYTFGQAYKPGMPWPKITVHNHARTINYETGSMRDEITLSRAEPKGGGGYPPVAQQRNDQFISGTNAWNQTGAGPVAGPRLVNDRTHQLWITPHGVIKAAIRNHATLQKPGKGAKALTAVSFTEPGRFIATVFINADNLVERVESRIPDPVLGETDAVTRYADYRDFGGVKFPMKIQQSQGGFPVLDVNVRQVEPNTPADIQVPDAVRAASEKVTIDKVADGVWFVSGGSHNSVAIEMNDHMILVESPLNDGRALPVIEQVRQLAPGKPIRYLINSHQHFDHAGGVRAAVAEGATVITQAGNQAYFERAFALRNKIAPDRLAASGKKVKFRTVNDKLVLTDGARTIEIHRIKGSAHNDTFLMVYLPGEKLLIEADAYTPLPPNAPQPSPPNPNNVNLVENIERLKLSIDRILPLHGRVVPAADLYAAAGKAQP
jgi:glyoxylase-like metal-dependent hydrolase (beta-lactamase superfamily II)